jgi:hypothetical protein
MTPTTGTILIAKDPCEMRNGNGPELIVGKEYKVHSLFHRSNKIAIKSELYEFHGFSLDEKDEYYWGNFFTIKTKQ